MHLEQFFVEGLGHQSYLVGSDSTRTAAVVDPRRDIAVYIEAATRAGLAITAVFETHVHNDFLSGAALLARETGAEHIAPSGAGLTFPYRPIEDGDEVPLGELRFRALHTPGHTPEHVSYALFDVSRSPSLPLLVFTGGDLLVGAVGRPDLLGRELGELLAPQLYDSLQEKLLTLGDGVIVMPSHGAGSLCGKGIAATRTTTIGYERQTSPALLQPGKDAFVRFVLQDNPGIPAYYARMRPANQSGSGPTAPAVGRALAPGEVEHLAGHGAVILDTRTNVAFGSAHIPGALNIGLAPLLATWAGWLISPERPLLLVLEREQDFEAIATALLRVGYDNIGGFLRGGMTAWVEHALPVVRLAQSSVHEVHERLERDPAIQVLDVRTEAEWRSGAIAGALHSPLGSSFPASLDSLALDRSRPLVVVCGSGYRSSIAASLLQAAGFASVVNTLGGMAAWHAANLPLGGPAAPR